VKEKKLLLIFVKNPEKGKVKTRLAKTVGEEKAYNTYLKLLEITLKVASEVHASKQIWYSSHIDKSDSFLGKPSERFERSDGSSIRFEKKLQHGENLGERMENAFRQGFDDEFSKIVIIGSDCPDISPEIIEDAFEILNQNDVVIGPSEDGGYYLLGLKRMISEVFKDISWSTKHVLLETITILKSGDIEFELLPTLNAIDTIEDLQKSEFE